METSPFNPVFSKPAETPKESAPKETPRSPELLARGTVGYYPSSQCLMFAFPTNLLNAIHVKPETPGQPFFAKTAGDGWELIPGGDKARAATVGKRTTITIYVNADRILSHKRGFFRATAAEFLAIDGRLLVSLAEPPLPYDGVAKITRKNRVKAPKPAAQEPLQTVASSPLPNTLITKMTKTKPTVEATSIIELIKNDLSENNLRAVLYALRYIEEHTLYVISRADGKLVLTPKIKRIE